MALQGFEARVERMVEGVFSRAFRSSLKPIELGRRLVREMDAHRTLDVHGRAIVPNVFRFRLSPADHHAFSAIEGPLVRELVDAAKEHARDEGYGFLGPLRVELVPDDSLKSGRITLASELSAASRPAGGVARTTAPAAAPSPDPVIAPRPVEPQPAPAPAAAAPDLDAPAWANEVAWGADASGAAGTLLAGAEAAAAAAASPAANPASPAPKPALPDTTVAPSAVPPTVVQAAAPTATLELATGERFDLHPGRPATIGRLPTCEVVVTDPNVSRRHCEVRPAGDGWLVADLGSTNGTRVGGTLVQGEQLLHHGDIITIGATRLRFEVR